MGLRIAVSESKAFRMTDQEVAELVRESEGLEKKESKKALWLVISLAGLVLISMALAVVVSPLWLTPPMTIAGAIVYLNRGALFSKENE